MPCKGFYKAPKSLIPYEDGLGVEGWGMSSNFGLWHVGSWGILKLFMV